MGQLIGVNVYQKQQSFVQKKETTVTLLILVAAKLPDLVVKILFVRRQGVAEGGAPIQQPPVAKKIINVRSMVIVHPAAPLVPTILVGQ